MNIPDLKIISTRENTVLPYLPGPRFPQLVFPEIPVNGATNQLEKY
jgi:hypothetical protein